MYFPVLYILRNVSPYCPWGRNSRYWWGNWQWQNFSFCITVVSHFRWSLKPRACAPRSYRSLIPLLDPFALTSASSVLTLRVTLLCCRDGLGSQKCQSYRPQLNLDIPRIPALQLTLHTVWLALSLPHNWALRIRAALLVNACTLQEIIWNLWYYSGLQFCL